MTAFSRDEEQQIELPQMNGRAPHDNDEALASAVLGSRVRGGADREAGRVGKYLRGQ